MKRLKNHYIFHAGISCFFYLGNGAFTVILSMYCQDIGLNASQIAVLLSAAPLLSIATQPYFGYIADKWKSPRKVAMMLLSLAGTCMFIFAISRNFWILLLSSAFACSFMNAVMPLTDRIGVSSPYQFGKIRLWGSIGYAFMAQISGLLYTYISPFSNFMAGILGVMLTIISVYMVCDPAVNEKKAKEVSTSEAMSVLIHNKAYVMFVIISFFFWGTNMTNMNYLSIFFKSLGGNAANVGTYQLFATLFEIPVILSTDWLFKKVSFKKTILFAVIMSLINFTWYSTLPSIKMIIAVFVFKGLSTVLFTMITVRIIIQLVDDRYLSTAYGIQAMLAKGFGPMIFQMIGGRIIDASTMTIYYYFLAAGIIVALTITLFFKIPDTQKSS